MGEPNQAMDDTHDSSLSGRCDHCKWSATAVSHSAIVEAYQDHLRERHPEAWLRG